MVLVNWSASLQGSSTFLFPSFFSVVLYAVTSNCITESNSCTRIDHKYLQPHANTAFAVTPFLGDMTPFSKPGRRFGNYVASLGCSFTVVNIVGSRPAFRVSSVVLRSVFTHGLSIQT